MTDLIVFGQRQINYDYEFWLWNVNLYIAYVNNCHKRSRCHVPPGIWNEVDT